MRPHTEHILLLGNQRLAMTSSAPFRFALYSNCRRCKSPCRRSSGPACGSRASRARSSPRRSSATTPSPRAYWSRATSLAACARWARASGPAGSRGVAPVVLLASCCAGFLQITIFDAFPRELASPRGVQISEDARSLTSLRARRRSPGGLEQPPGRLAPQDFCGPFVSSQGC